jgi:hypothetical protein
VHFGDPETSSLNGTSRKPIFFNFWPNEVLKKPSYGFLDVLKTLEPSIWHFEHCEAHILPL